MRLLVCLHTPRSPQSAVYLSYTDLAAHLGARGHTVTIRAPEDFPEVTRVHARWLPILYPWAVWRRLRREGSAYDLVVFHSYAGWVAGFWRRRPFRMITAFHGLEPLFYRELAVEMRRAGRPLRLPFRVVHGGFVPRVLRAACRRSDAVFCLNRSEAAFLVERGWAESSRVEVVRHGVGAEFFVPRASRSGQVDMLLFVGQWLPTKGTSDLVAAFAALAPSRLRLQLACVGTLVDGDRVRGDFPAALRSRVDVFPRVERAGLVEHYRRADIFVFPTLFEGFSRALVEAMASGLAIVTTPAGAAPEILTDGVDALLVPKRDAGALAAAVGRVLEDPSLRARLGAAAQARAREFESGRVLAETERCLLRVARGA